MSPREAFSLRENLERVRVRIATAARSKGRDPSQVRLVCVTKGVSVERIQEAVALGVTEIGENRVQEAQEKQPLIGRQVRCHLIGHLQRNKAKQAVELFDLIHSVDSLELIEALDRHAARPLEILIQVNVSGEATKHGCKREEVDRLAEAVLKSKHLQFSGLMTMAPFSDGPETSRPIFRQLRELRDALQQRLIDLSLTPYPLPLHLSMGMSQDFEVAVEEGATMVRVGTAIFQC